MKCDRSVIIMTLHWHSSQISNFDNCVDALPLNGLIELNRISAPTRWIDQDHVKVCLSRAYRVKVKHMD